MECQCEKDNIEDAVSGWWLSGNGVQMGAFTVVGYLLYRFSQTLPALIRWPIRIFCSITGLSALWGWVNRLVRTFRVIKTLCKWLSRIWKFFAGSSSDGCLRPMTLRLILLGPAGGGRTSLAHTLLGNSETEPIGHLTECTKQTAVIDNSFLTVIDTPDLLGTSLGNSMRAMEALRPLQLASPGPHAFLLVTQAPGSSKGLNQDASETIQTMLELYGEGVMQYIIPVVTHADCLGQKRTLDQLLDVDAGRLRTVMSLCGQRPELVDNRPDCPSETQSITRRHLLDRVMEMKKVRGHFVHELQNREDRLREELLADMASALARELGHA
ncbi:uncharacterized protein KZ484_002663 [Pholidichthys leucotaenia]